MKRPPSHQPSKTTAQTAQDVMWWIETKPHHVAAVVEGTNPGMQLKGHHHWLFVPKKIWKQCHVKASGEFDRRMFRWDHEAHRVQVHAGRFSRKVREAAKQHKEQRRKARVEKLAQTEINNEQPTS